MSSKSVQQSIKVALNVLTKAIKQVPNDKQALLTSRVNDVLSKYMKNPNPSQQQLKMFQKQLEFNLNFIKLSHPNLDFTPSTAEELSQTQQQPKQEDLKKGLKPEAPHKVQIVNQQSMEYERMPNDIFDQAEERQKNIRQEVQFSNWFEGNVDPQLLQKHKNLLERQHFTGDYWKGKQKPTIPAKEYLMHAMAAAVDSQSMPKKQKQLEDMTPSNSQQLNWQKIKR